MIQTSAAPEQKPPIGPPRADTQTQTLVRSALDDIAVVVGNAASMHELDDALVWSVSSRLDRIRVQLLRDLKGLEPRNEAEPGTRELPRVHPAVDEFLARNRAGMGE